MAPVVQILLLFIYFFRTPASKDNGNMFRKTMMTSQVVVPVSPGVCAHLDGYVSLECSHAVKNSSVNIM